MKRLIAIIALAIFVSAAPAPNHAQAQTWPSRQITLIVPFPPGGSTDVVARIMAEGMRPLLGQPVIIENVGGAGGSIGVGRDLQKDFEPIGLLSINPQLMVGRKDLPADDLKSLAAWMKANPGKATLVNQLASALLAGQLFQQLTGTKLQFIPYRGAGPAMTDLIAGQVDLIVSQAAVLLPNIQAKTIKPLANLSPGRSAAIPDIPTADESGVPGLYASGWFGFFAPKGTPKEIVAKLNAAMVRVLNEPSTRPRFTQLGLDIASPELQTPEGLAAFHKAEIEKWWPIIKAANIRTE
jgi:tripartite-type tricarboxylate transporter receptor subunit TctC